MNFIQVNLRAKNASMCQKELTLLDLDFVGHYKSTKGERRKADQRYQKVA